MAPKASKPKSGGLKRITPHVKPNRKGPTPSPVSVRLSARTITLVDALDGPPRQGLAATTQPHSILRHILQQIAPAFDALCKADTQDLLEKALVCIGEIYRRAARGELDASSDILRLATHAVRLLNKLADHQRRALRGLARTQFSWPAELSTKPEVNRIARERLRDLELGEDCSLKTVASARWSLENFATQYVMHVLRAVKKEKEILDGLKADGIEVPKGALSPWYLAVRVLPPLHKGNADHWFDVAIWPLILQSNEGHPERDRVLRRIGGYRVGMAIEAKPDERSGSAEARIRDGIKTRLRQAFKNAIAAASPTDSHHSIP